MYFTVYIDQRNELRCNLKADNHEIIADSAEGYINKTDCLHGIDLVKQSSDAQVKE